MNLYVDNLIKDLPQGYKFLSLKENPQWKIPLRDICVSISKSKDLNGINYSKKRFPINRQIDIILLVEKNKILAFSSIWQSSHFPKDCVRVLNRTWKDPSIRNQKNMFQRKIMVIFLAYHIDLVLKIKNINFIFSSMEGVRSNWWKRWVCEADKVYTGWKIYPNRIKVCDGPYSKCWQSCVYLNLRTKDISQLPFPSITPKKWLQLIKNE